MEDWVLDDDAPESARRHTRSWPKGYVWLSSQMHNAVQARISNKECKERTFPQVIRSAIKLWLEEHIEGEDDGAAGFVLAAIEREEIAERSAAEDKLVWLMKTAEPQTPWERTETIRWGHRAGPAIQDPSKRAAFERYLRQLEGE